MSQTSSEVLNQRFPGIVTSGDGTRLNPFVIRTPSPTASTLAQIFLLEQVCGSGTYERSARAYFESASGTPGNKDLCEYRASDGEVSLWFDLSFVTKLSGDPSLHAERNRIEEGMPLAGGRFFVVDAHTSSEASEQIIFRLNQARAEGWQTGNAVSKAWHNEYDITKDGVNSKLLFDLRPTIGRVNRMELTIMTMAAARPQAQQNLARMESGIRPKAAGCVALVLALIGCATLFGTVIAFGLSLLV
jgi:hypothetical protein